MRPEASFGEIPSAEIRQLDHSTWWAAFMGLVGTMPRKAESSRLSSDPVHMIHGQYFSIRDCAVRAIDAAYAENLPQTARDYEEQARKLISSYDKRVYIRVSRIFDGQRLRYLAVCAACLLFSVVLAFLYSGPANGSKGLLVLIAAALIAAAASAVMAALTTRRKRKILYHLPHSGNENPHDAGTGEAGS